MGKSGLQLKLNKNKALSGKTGGRTGVDSAVELDLSKGTLGLPHRLCADGKACWKDLMASFPSWYFTKADKEMQIIYCEQVALKTRLERDMRNKSAVVTRENGTECLNPRLKAINGTSVLILKLAEALQITRQERRGLAQAANELPRHLQTHCQTLKLAGEELAGDIGDLMAAPVFER